MPPSPLGSLGQALLPHVLGRILQRHQPLGVHRAPLAAPVALAHQHLPLQAGLAPRKRPGRGGDAEPLAIREAACTLQGAQTLGTSVMQGAVGAGPAPGWLLLQDPGLPLPPRRWPQEAQLSPPPEGPAGSARGPMRQRRLLAKLWPLSPDGALKDRSIQRTEGGGKVCTQPAGLGPESRLQGSRRGASWAGAAH